jgi:protocatechuate 3,4-dioxygenase beta subunit
MAAIGVVIAACTTAVDATTTSSIDAETGTTTTTIVDEPSLPVTTQIDAPAPSADEALPLPITPAQQEGPFYPVETLADQDNDLTVVAGLDGAPTGNVLILQGRLLTGGGAPVEGGVVEIWQVDSQGIYLHPGDPRTDDRDPYFQFSGRATVAADGTWTFRTIDPGYYEPRPRHIHVKVRLDDEVVLTTQIYFSNDPSAAGIDPLLVAAIGPGTDGEGIPVLIAEHRIVLP